MSRADVQLRARDLYLGDGDQAPLRFTQDGTRCVRPNSTFLRATECTDGPCCRFPRWQGCVAYGCRAEPHSRERRITGSIRIGHEIRWIASGTAQKFETGREGGDRLAGELPASAPDSGFAYGAKAAGGVLPFLVAIEASKTCALAICLLTSDAMLGIGASV